MTTSHSDGLLTTAEAAELLRVHVRTLRMFVRDGRLNQIRLGHRTVRFRREDLNAFMMARSETGKNAEETTDGTDTA